MPSMLRHSSARKAAASFGALLVATAPALACAADDRASSAPATASASAASRGSLVLHVENEAGRVIESAQADVAINPASVVKAATTLWAIEQLGPEHRFETRFGYRGTFDKASGRIDGDLVVHGGGDPDFHVENAYLVAMELNRLGVREVRGSLLVNATFWLGWEGGSEKREKDAKRRATQMATRLRDALDSQRWSDGTQRSIAEFETRRGLKSKQRPRVTVSGAARGLGAESKGATTPLVLHRSNPLVAILKRFNAYSNNDIERLGAHLGSAAELQTQLARRLGGAADTVRFKTLSGLDSNRLTPRQVVGLMRLLTEACKKAGIQLADVFPVAGCDPGTLKHYPRLRDQLSGNLVAKTGTLNVTDGGVSALAGVLNTGEGPRIFCVATPGAGGQQTRARARQETWVLEMVQQGGGAKPSTCGAVPAFSDQRAEVTAVTEKPS